MNYRTLTLFIFLLLPFGVTAQQFTPLVGIPGVSDPTTDLNTYINALYALSISIAALLAVIKIIIAGVKWMLSDVVTTKQDAKNDIQGATLGLLLVISAVLIFNTINPNITSTSLFIAPVGNPTNTAPTQSSTGAFAHTLEDSDTKTALPNTQENRDKCEDTGGEYNGDWYADGDADTGWCVVRAKDNLYRQEEYGCIPSSGAPNGYDCSEGTAKCTKLGGEAVPAKSKLGNIQYFRIACVPKN